MSQNGLCPFSWIQISQLPGCVGSLLGAKPSQVWQPQVCMGSQCRLWDVGANNCVLPKEGVASFAVTPPVRTVSLADRLKKVQPEDGQQASSMPYEFDGVPAVGVVPLADRLKKVRPENQREASLQPQQGGSPQTVPPRTASAKPGVKPPFVFVGVAVLIALGIMCYWASNRGRGPTHQQPGFAATSTRAAPAPSRKTPSPPVPVSPQQRAKLPQEPTAAPSSLPAPAPAPPTQAEPATSIRGDDLLGEWKGSFVNRNQPKKFTLHIKQAENNALRAEGKADTWTLLELFEGSLVGNTVILRGYEVKPTPAPGKNYSLDVFKLTLSADGKTLKGTWTDTDKSTGDIEVSRVGSISSLSATQAVVKAPAIKEDGLDQQIRADADEAISAAFKSGSTKEYLYNAGSARQTLWREAADSGVAEALWLMGCCYDNGVGISAPDPVRAFEYYLKSADKDYGPALNDVGLSYGLGKGVPKDLMRAVQYYKRAASKNRPSAWFNLGSCYEQGLGGLPKDSKQAIDCYKKAKDLGYGLAEKALARFHQ